MTDAGEKAKTLFAFTKNESQDFVTFSKNLEKGRPSQEYYITLDMAKQLAMVENNESGLPAPQICGAGP